MLRRFVLSRGVICHETQPDCISNSKENGNKILRIKTDLLIYFFFFLSLLISTVINTSRINQEYQIDEIALMRTFAMLFHRWGKLRKEQCLYFPMLLRTWTTRTLYSFMTSVYLGKLCISTTSSFAIHSHTHHTCSCVPFLLFRLCTIWVRFSSHFSSPMSSALHFWLKSNMTFLSSIRLICCSVFFSYISSFDHISIASSCISLFVERFYK